MKDAMSFCDFDKERIEAIGEGRICGKLIIRKGLLFVGKKCRMKIRKKFGSNFFGILNRYILNCLLQIFGDLNDK